MSVADDKTGNSFSFARNFVGQNENKNATQVSGRKACDIYRARCHARTLTYLCSPPRIFEQKTNFSHSYGRLN